MSKSHLFDPCSDFGHPGPKKKSIDPFWPPLGSALAPDRAPGTSSGAALAAEHAPGTPSGPSKNRSERKMKMLILHWFYHQHLSPDVLLPIQDPQKRAPMDLINFPEGPLGSYRGPPQKTLRLLGGPLGAKHTSRSPLWPPLEITKMQLNEKRDFFCKSIKNLYL